MPKAILSNDKGLVQSSGNGLRLTPKNSLGGGLHFKTVEVSLVGLTPDSNDNKFLKATGITLPAQSIVLGASAVVTEKANIAVPNNFSLISEETFLLLIYERLRYGYFMKKHKEEEILINLNPLYFS